MKHIRITILLILLSSSVSQAQVIRGAVLGGINLSQVDGDEVYGFHKFGWTAGAAAIIPLGNNFTVSLENNFSQRGSYQRPRFNDSLSGSYRLQLNYVDVPVLLHYTDKDIITAGMGLSWGRLVRVKEAEHGQRVATTTLDGPYRRNDVAWMGDLRFRLHDRFHFNLRYTYSLAKIRTREFPKINTVRDQYNNFITFRLIYIFNEKVPEKKD